MRLVGKLLLFVAILKLAHADVFTAMVDLENLLTSESDLTQGIIQDYIAAERSRLDRLQKFAAEYSVKNAKSTGKDTDIVMNPVNAYLLIKRLTSDWKYITHLMKSNTAEYFIKNITQGREDNAVKYPDEEDLEGAAVALIRLQDTYKLSTKELSQGIVAGDTVGTPLSAQDCFEVGRAAYNQKDYYHTLQWMMESLEKLKYENPPTKKESDILEYLAYALYKQGNVKRALKMTKKLALLEPNHPRAAGNVKWYEDMLDEEENSDLNDIPPLKNERDLKYDIQEREAFEKLCRGEFTPNITMESQTYCYLKRDRPFLKLAPIKVEIIRYEPLVVIFHQVISDYEISVVKELATPRLKRATVQNAKTGELEHANYRISKSAWLKDHEHPVFHRINQRIDMMTNLNQETSEDLQVSNYGLGGHYDPHFDHARMSQPDKGGATVYTELGSGVFPQLHNALYWYNLKRDGEGDVRTRHAACPVLTGVKWVLNKWIHERGQEFRRPCGLTPDVEERYIGDLSPY